MKTLAVVLPPFLGLIGGAFGWWVTNFFLRPKQVIEELREKAHEELIYYANVGETSPDNDRANARLSLRRTGAGLLAAAEGSPWWIRWWWTRKKWDLLLAGHLFVGQSNLLDDHQMKRRLMKALDLPNTADTLGIAGRRAPDAPAA